MKKIYILFFLLSVPVSLFAEQSESVTFENMVSRIVGINWWIDTHTNTTIKEKLFQERTDLLQKAQILARNFDTKISKKPTFDTSSSYSFFLQKYKLSCEIAALTMTINSFSGRQISEDDIIASLPVFPWPLSPAGIWGDPDREFVGSYHGSQRLQTGYGIYELPLSKYLDTLSIKNEISNRFIAPTISPSKRIEKSLKALHAGSRVILWWDWCTQAHHEDGLAKKVDMYILRALPIAWKNSCERKAGDRVFSWYTPDGKYISGLSWEHAFILLGYMWPLKKPTHIIVWDTDTGRHIYSYTEWMRKWRYMDYRTLIIEPKDIGGI